MDFTLSAESPYRHDFANISQRFNRKLFYQDSSPWTYILPNSKSKTKQEAFSLPPDLQDAKLRVSAEGGGLPPPLMDYLLVG